MLRHDLLLQSSMKEETWEKGKIQLIVLIQTAAKYVSS